MSDFKKALIETLLETGRVALLTVVSWLLATGVDSLFSGLQMDPQLKAIIVYVVFAVLRSLDKFLHELGKESKNAGLTAGLTRF